MTKEEMTNASVKDLANRLNTINIELQNLQIEYNLVVETLWDRIPSLTTDINIQKQTVEIPPKVFKKGKK